MSLRMAGPDDAEDRRPLCRRAAADQDVAGLDLVQFGHRGDYPRHALRDALGRREATEFLCRAAALERLEEVPGQAEDLDHDRIGHRIGNRAQHGGKLGAAVPPVLEIGTPVGDHRGQRGPPRSVAVHDGEQFGLEQEEDVVWLLELALVHQARAKLQAGAADRDRGSPVDQVVVFLVPPGEVRCLVAGQRLVEALQVRPVDGAPRRFDLRVPLGHRILPRRLEVEARGLCEEGRDRVQRRRRVLDPGRRVDPAGLLGPPAVRLEELVELVQPGASVRERPEQAAHSRRVRVQQRTGNLRPGRERLGAESLRITGIQLITDEIVYRDDLRLFLRSHAKPHLDPEGK